MWYFLKCGVVVATLSGNIHGRWTASPYLVGFNLFDSQWVYCAGQSVERLTPAETVHFELQTNPDTPGDYFPPSPVRL
jgi:hypothetical protein